MNLRPALLAILVGLAITQPARADFDFARAINTAIGGAAGGVVGNQVGKGNGKTVATASGAAAGAVAGSGCKATAGTVAGGALGGWLGAQMGGNAGAGAGAAIGAVVGSDCSESSAPPKPATAGYTPTAGRTVRLNGMQLVEANPADFPMGKFQGFPRIQTKADFAALDAMAKGYAKASWEAAARQDWEGFAVNRRLGMRIVEYRLHHKLAALDFVSSMSASKTGTGTLAPGATVFLPAFTRYGSDQKLASQDYQHQILSANLSDVDWNTAPKVADIGDLLGTINKVAGAITGNKNSGGGIGKVAPQTSNEDMLNQLPVGAVFSAHDASGNSYLVERTPEGYNVSNPGGRPVSVPLGQLGYMPDMPEPSAARQETGELIKHMQAVRQQLFWQAMRSGFTNGISSVTKAPNQVVILKSPVAGFLDQNGDLAADPVAESNGAAAYKSSAAYREALNLVNTAKHKDRQFQDACFARSDVAAYDTDFIGPTAEILRHECFNKSKQIVQVRDFYVRDGKTMQTAASLLQDKAIANKLKNADSARDLAEAMMGFVPLAGNLDAAAKCLTGTSLTAASSSLFSNYENEQYRAFVSDLLPSPSDPSAVEQGLTCASAIPALGTVAKGLSKAGNVAGLYRDWAAGEKAQAVFKGLDFFETNVFSKGAQFDSIGALSSNSVATLKGYYDKIQTLSGITQAAAAL